MRPSVKPAPGQRPKLLAGVHVSDLARRTGVSAATIRYYSRAGLLNPGREPENGYRRFTSDDEHRVTFIRQAQALGLTLSDIQRVFDDVGRGELPCDHVVGMVETRLVEVEREIEALREKQERIRGALEHWKKAHSALPHADEYCPLIERFNDASVAS